MGELLYSNLGGHGPELDKPHAIRYVNVGNTILAGGLDTFRFDLVVTAQGEEWAELADGTQGVPGCNATAALQLGGDDADASAPSTFGECAARCRAALGAPSSCRFFEFSAESGACSLFRECSFTRPAASYPSPVKVYGRRYTPFDPALNGLNGQFAQINVMAGTQVDLRVKVFPSCCVNQNCKVCEQLPEGPERDGCYEAGCCCNGPTCRGPDCCSAEAKEVNRHTYQCPQMDTPFRLPGQALVGMTVYDFDNGPSGEYVEELTVLDYAYYRTPLTPSSGVVVPPTVEVELLRPGSGTFRSTALGSYSDNPTDPQHLSEEQVSPPRMD